MARRLHRWLDVAGWTLGEASKVGALRAFCPRPDCDYEVRNFRPPSVSADVRLHEIARRMRCTGCARTGANLEIWTSDPIGSTGRSASTKRR